MGFITVDANEKLTKMTKREVSALKSIKNELLLDLIFQKLPIAVELYDEHGILSQINKAGLKLFGMQQENVIGILDLFASPIIPQEKKELIRKGIEVEFEMDYDFRVVAKKQYYKSEHTDLCKRMICTIIPLKDSFENIFGYIFLVYDISEDHSQKKQLKYNLTKLRMALDTGKALIWEYDIETNKLSYDETISGDISSWVSMHDDNTSMFTAEGQMQGIHPDDTDRFYKAVMPIMHGETDQETITYRQYMNGKLEWLTSNFRSMKNEGSDKPSKVFCYTMIVTEHHNTEIELIKMKEADRLKTAFMENLSHEIRTPLNAIVGFSTILAESNPSEENEEFIRLINENNEALLNLVTNLLDLSKLDANEVEYEYKDFNIKSLGEELSHTYRQKKSHNISLTHHNNLPFTTFCSDEKRIKQVISLLLDNALKFTEEGEIDLTFDIEGDLLKVIISDTGIGISEQDYPHLFNPFYQKDVFQKGTGLGLHISQKLVQALGGHIGFHSEEGKGSQFWFTLPAKR